MDAVTHVMGALVPMILTSASRPTVKRRTATGSIRILVEEMQGGHSIVLQLEDPALIPVDFVLRICKNFALYTNDLHHQYYDSDCILYNVTTACCSHHSWYSLLRFYFTFTSPQ